MNEKLMGELLDELEELAYKEFRTLSKEHNNDFDGVKRRQTIVSIIDLHQAMVYTLHKELKGDK